MDKRWFLLVILIIAAPVAYALTNIIVNETDLVALAPTFDDPDGDVLEYSYSYPLNEEGEWQTNYGDEGNYIVAISASDGELITEEEVIIVVNKKEEPPEIYDFSPKDVLLSIEEGESLYFRGDASDINKDELTYKWFFDEDFLGEGKELDYNADYFDQGEHIITLEVSDGTLKSYQEWAVDVEDIDRIILLDNITDIEMHETDTISLELPDFEAYNLEYEISEPIGNDNFWEPTYDDAGEYMITITIRDRSFEHSKRINVMVNNVDRSPTFEPVYDRAISEGEEVIITPGIIDPDGDEVIISVIDAPEGSRFENNVFTWSPDRDFVGKTNFYTNLLDKFHILRKTHAVTFLAESNELSISKTVKIRVSDDNRAPTIEDMGTININEGETISLEPNVYDLDGDKVSYKLSGWMDKAVRETSYDDAGTYTVFVRAYDGKSSAEKTLTIIVNDVNRAPSIDEIPKQDVNEGEIMQFSIYSYDPDNDEITTSVENEPAGSSFDENMFSWTPGYDETKSREVRQYTVTFTASDGSQNSSTDALINVHNTNKAPIVLNVSPIVGQFGVYAGDSVVFQVLAQDPDGDKLSYEWIFGPIQRYKGSPVHARRFIVPGEKEVRAVVSDGKSAVIIEWTVNVLETTTLQPKVITGTEPQPQPITAPAQPEPQQVQPTPAPAQPEPVQTAQTFTYKTYVVTEMV